MGRCAGGIMRRFRCAAAGAAGAAEATSLHAAARAPAAASGSMQGNDGEHGSDGATATVRQGDGVGAASVQARARQFERPEVCAQLMSTDD